MRRPLEQYKPNGERSDEVWRSGMRIWAAGRRRPSQASKEREERMAVSQGEIDIQIDKWKRKRAERGGVNRF